MIYVRLRQLTAVWCNYPGTTIQNKHVGLDASIKLITQEHEVHFNSQVLSMPV